MSSGVRKLPRSFYLRPTVAVAKALLGKYLVRKMGKKFLIGRIVETEAYCAGDPASHSYRGKTRRNEVMYWEGGHLYVYFTYGMHFCANVVTGKQGVGEAVLLRAVEPIEGVGVMMKRRGVTVSTKDFRNLTNGPAKVCEAFGIVRKHNSLDLCGNEIWIAGDARAGHRFVRITILASSRIGVRNGRDKKWRFYVKGNSFVGTNPLR